MPESAIVLKPTSVITLTAVEITGTISTRHRAILVWSVEGKRERYFGIVDFDEALIRRLKPTITDFNPTSIPTIAWSPGGAQFMYRTPGLDYYDVTAFHVDASTDALHVDMNAPAGFCEWAPLDGRYLLCFTYCSHWPYTRIIFDTNTWQEICRGGNLVCASTPNEPCPNLLLADGTTWKIPPQSFSTATPQPSPSGTDKLVSASIAKFCQILNKTDECKTNTISPDKHFVALSNNNNQFVVAIAQDQLWYLGNETAYQSASWSADSQYLAWIAENQVRVLDVNTHEIAAYTLPDVSMLSVDWSPLR